MSSESTETEPEGSDRVTGPGAAAVEGSSDSGDGSWCLKNLRMLLRPGELIL